MEGANIVPVMDMNRNNNYGDGFGWGGGMWFMWIFVIFALMGGGGFGWGNRGNALTQAEMQAGFNHQDEMNQIRGITYGLSDATYALNNTMQQGFNAAQRDLFGTQRDIMQTGYQLGSEIAQNRFAAQQCCCEQKQAVAALGCETNRNIDAVRYENARNTCEVVNAIKEDGEKTRALIVANQIQDLRDKLADRDRDLQTAKFDLSQQEQNRYLTTVLRPFPQPAYITTSPYQSQPNAICGCAGYAQQVA